MRTSAVGGRAVNYRVVFAHRDTRIQVNRELRVTEGLNMKRIRKILKISLDLIPSSPSLSVKIQIIG